MAISPPSSPSQGRRRGSAQQGRALSPGPRAVDDAQLAQDIDAARQMSRARANSISQQQHAAAATSSSASGSTPGAPQPVATSPHGVPIAGSFSGGSSGHGAAGGQSHRPSVAGPAGANEYTSTSPTAFHHTQQPQGAGSFSRSPTSPMYAYSQQQAQAQATRFYMQHQRHGSNTSVDSASHFIDHRNQQASVPQMSPAAFQRGPISRRSQSRLEPVSFDQQRGGSTSNALGGTAVEDDTMAVDADEAITPRSYMSRGGPARPSMQARNSRRSGRLVDIGDDDHDEDRGAAGLSPQQTVSEAPPHTPSRRHSLAQEDVWFPMHAQQGGDAIQLDDQHEYDDGQAQSEHSAGPPHLPPGFPFTFDLGLLEEYVQQERKRADEEAAENNTGAFGMRRRGATSIAATRDVKDHIDENPSRRPLSGAYGVSPSSDDATFYSRRPRKFINVPGIEADSGKSSNRYQRKLALFEGASSSPPPIGARSGGAGGIFGGGSLMQDERDRHRQQAAVNENGFPADTKTPLLDTAGRSVPSYQGADSPHDRADDSAGAGKQPVSRSFSMGADLGNLVKRAKGTSRPMHGAGARTSSFGGERQYRFTFYSNALPNTIHARHLFELPAPGQSFEELLLGIDPQQRSDKDKEPEPEEQMARAQDPKTASAAPQTSAAAAAAAADTSNGNASRSGPRQVSALTNAINAGRLEGSTAPNTGSNTPEHTPHLNTNGRVGAAGRSAGTGPAAPGGMRGSGIGAHANLSSAQMAAIEKTRTLPGGGLRVDQDSDTCTWWLDVLSPSDQEMKMIARVFGIHPLTVEDILMEEIREKIELFRNYYLVCFRSFDQDPYSPTYLEPLNMYVIVFREGTLSFHFRATPHPVNVRRRIKQLKDYINVTSDWISYALIDDITDAFGPLISSIEYEVDSIDELVLILKEAEQSDMLLRCVRGERR